MKVSEIFLDYCSPLLKEMPSDATIEFLRRAYIIPELVWNAVVLDKNHARKPGELPAILKSAVKERFPSSQQMGGEFFLTFWVKRKDAHFSQHDWPLSVEIYKNLKSQTMVRVLAFDNSNHKVTIPKKWTSTEGAAVVPLGTR